VAYHQSDYRQALDYYRQSLTIAHSTQALALLLISLLGFAWHYLQGNEPTRAGELCGLAQHHPAFNSDVEEHTDEVLPLLQAALPPAELLVALERGKILDLDTVVTELLDEFGEDNA
jgi:hypothetical protein